MAIKSFKRFEKKFILNQTEYDNLLLKLEPYMTQDEYCKLSKTYDIFNIYYDTDTDDVIRHSIASPYYKEKLRLRTYTNPTNLNSKVFLELKKKINGIVSKRRVVLTLKEAYDFLESGKPPITDDYINNQVIREIEYYLSQNKVKPKVYIAYTRNALFAKDDRDFRITFDSKILTRRNYLSLEDGCFGKDILGTNKYLMEVKFLGAIPVWFTKILSELEIYNTHFSKYGNEYMDYSYKKRYGIVERRKAIC